jgi:hypothetical protein
VNITGRLMACKLAVLCVAFVAAMVAGAPAKHLRSIDKSSFAAADLDRQRAE